MLNSGKAGSNDGDMPNNHLAAAMGVTFSKDGTVVGHPANEDAGLSRRYSSGKDEDEEFFQKTVSINSSGK